MDNKILKDSEEPFFSVNHLFRFSGRRKRFEFFKVFCFWQMILKFPLYYLGTVLFLMFVNSYYVFIVIASLVDLILSYPLLCNTIKRLHDLNCSYKWAFAYFILNNLAFYNYFFIASYLIYDNELFYFWTINVLIAIGVFLAPFLVLFFKKGTKGSNKYGEEP